MKYFFKQKFSKKLFFIPLFLFFVIGFFNIGNAQNVPGDISPLASTVFTRTLSVGSDNIEVAELKSVLNSDSRTKILDLSLYPEKNTYFGDATKKAVIKFQELYASEVLHPLGLTGGTGVVGSYTRAKLNNVAQNKENSGLVRGDISQNNNDSGVLQGNQGVSLDLNVQDDENMAQYNAIYNRLSSLFALFEPVKVYSVEKYQVLPQGSVTLKGSGFKPMGNTVHIGENHRIENVASFDGKTLRLSLPLGVSEGKQPIWVSNSNGSSRNPQVEIYLFITNSPQDPPQITSISPAFVSPEGEMTITGKNFTAINNTVYSGFGTITGVNSKDGTSLRINVGDFAHIKALTENPDLKGTNHSLWLFVQNENGVTVQPYFFSVSIQ